MKLRSFQLFCRFYSDNMAEDITFWTDFFTLYKELPALWRVKSPQYSNRVIKNQSYEKLVAKLKEKIPDANRDYVVKKINNFRTAYRKELKKVKQSEKSGAGADDVYEPSLWYFPLLSFLEDQEDFNPGRSTIDNDFTEEESPIRKKKKMSDEDKLLKLACEQLEKERNEDEDDLLAKTWSNQVRQMDKKQKIIAQKLISDVIFHGCLGNLETFHTTELPTLLEKRHRPNSVISGYTTFSPASPYTEISPVYSPIAPNNIIPDTPEIQHNATITLQDSHVYSPIAANNTTPDTPQIQHNAAITLQEYFNKFTQ